MATLLNSNAFTVASSNLHFELGYIQVQQQQNLGVGRPELYNQNLGHIRQLSSFHTMTT